MPGTYEWVEESLLVVDGVEFLVRVKPRVESSATRFFVNKTPELAQAHLDLLGELAPRRIVELGILKGGSVALTALVARPDALVAFDNAAEPVPALAELLAAKGLTDTVHPVYAVDQADGARLGAVLDEIVGDQPLDLVVDDASHLVGPTRASFNALFPRLRPGGAYVIEDWGWAHAGFGTQLPGETPLSRLVFELTLLLWGVPGAVREIRIDRYWAVLVRGDTPLDAATFDSAAMVAVRGETVLTDPVLTDPPSGAGPSPPS